jgi:hypothetical protein
MNSRNDKLRLFLKGFMELCGRRRSGLHPSIAKTLLIITSELEQNKTPALENLLEFENKYELVGQADAHLRYLYCVLKGFRERSYRPSPSAGENQPL